MYLVTRNFEKKKIFHPFFELQNWKLKKYHKIPNNLIDTG
jgi:hypothetical protein